MQVNGSAHLTSQEITSIAAVSDDSTLLRLDSKGIKERLEDNAWVQNAAIHRVFPDTIVIDITEREPGAVSQDQRSLELGYLDGWRMALRCHDR